MALTYNIVITTPIEILTAKLLLNLQYHSDNYLGVHELLANTL